MVSSQSLPARARTLGGVSALWIRSSRTPQTESAPAVRRATTDWTTACLLSVNWLLKVSRAMRLLAVRADISAASAAASIVLPASRASSRRMSFTSETATNGLCFGVELSHYRGLLGRRSSAPLGARSLLQIVRAAGDDVAPVESGV